jgi:hypothetical protein
MSYSTLEPHPSVHEPATHVATSEAVQIRVFWEDALLEVIELSPPRPFYIGDGSVSREPVDFTVPDLEAERIALLVTEGGSFFVHAPAGAELFRREANAAFGGFAEPLGSRAALGSAPIDVRVGALTFSLRLGPREARCPRALGGEDRGRPLAYFAMSSAVVGALSAMMAYFAPPLGLTDEEGADRNRIYVINQYLDASAERERKPEQATGTGAGEAPDAPQPPARGESGRIGRIAPEKHSARGGGAEQSNVSRPAMSRAEAVQAAREFGMIGLLSGGNPGANVAPWDDPGAGPGILAGGLFGSDLETTGMGGLGLTGIGEGGGGKSNQIGMGRIGTCNGDECAGIGRSYGRPGGVHVARGPQVRTPGNSIVSGHIPSEVIQRIVRQSFGRFRNCYEDGLRTNPNLEGRVTARFVISRDGSVGAVQSGGSDLPDPRVVSCVLRTYSTLSFPSPENGIVTVTYPLSFSPSA